MKFAPVLPAEFYTEYDRGEYHMVQAHTVVGNRRVLEWMHEKSFKGHTVIVDNGLIELGTPDVGSLLAVVEKVHGAIPICPDAFCNMDATLELMVIHTPALTRICDTIMFVPHGADFGEWRDCARTMFTRIKLGVSANYMFALPKVLDTFTEDGRLMAVAYLTSIGIPQECMHLLGIWNGLHELDGILKNYPRIAGIDSTLPFAHAMTCARTGIGTDKCTVSKAAWQLTPYGLPVDKLVMLRENIEYVRRYIACNPKHQERIVLNARMQNAG